MSRNPVDISGGGLQIADFVRPERIWLSGAPQTTKNWLSSRNEHFRDFCSVITFCGVYGDFSVLYLHLSRLFVDSRGLPSSLLPSMSFSSFRSFLILGSARCINYLQTSQNLSPTCCRYRDSPTCRTKLGREMIGSSESERRGVDST
jgi:hypothetical protein